MLLGNLLWALAKVLDIAITVLIWLIIARAVLSWFRLSPTNQLVRFLYWATEPFLRPVQRLLWRYLPPAGIDFSPMVAVLLLLLLEHFLVRTLYQLAARFS